MRRLQASEPAASLLARLPVQLLAAALSFQHFSLFSFSNRSFPSIQQSSGRVNGERVCSTPSAPMRLHTVAHIVNSESVQQLRGKEEQGPCLALQRAAETAPRLSRTVPSRRGRLTP